MIRYEHRIGVEVHGESYSARSLRGSEVERIAQMGEKAGEDDAGASLEILWYIVACCLLGEDDKPEFQGEADVLKVRELPFPLIDAVAKAVMEDAGLGEAPASGN